MPNFFFFIRLPLHPILSYSILLYRSHNLISLFTTKSLRQALPLKLSLKYTCIAQSVGNTTQGNRPHRLHRREMRTMIKTHHPVVKMTIRRTILGKFSQPLLIKYGSSLHLQVKVSASAMRCSVTCRHSCDRDAGYDRDRVRDMIVIGIGTWISIGRLLSTITVSRLLSSSLSFALLILILLLSFHSLILPPTLTRQTSLRAL